ncbi:MAG: hypothetical protein HQK51_04170 [Oligoflexia bacterium]|nr:hypothetical protein [Oligoflexia bacterium]
MLKIIKIINIIGCLIFFVLFLFTNNINTTLAADEIAAQRVAIHTPAGEIVISADDKAKLKNALLKSFAGKDSGIKAAVFRDIIRELEKDGLLTLKQDSDALNIIRGLFPSTSTDAPNFGFARQESVNILISIKNQKTKKVELDLLDRGKLNNFLVDFYGQKYLDSDEADSKVTSLVEDLKNGFITKFDKNKIKALPGLNKIFEDTPLPEPVVKKVVQVPLPVSVVKEEVAVPPPVPVRLPPGGRKYVPIVADDREGVAAIALLHSDDRDSIVISVKDKQKLLVDLRKSFQGENGNMKAFIHKDILRSLRDSPDQMTISRGSPLHEFFKGIFPNDPLVPQTFRRQAELDLLTKIKGKGTDEVFDLSEDERKALKASLERAYVNLELRPASVTSLIADLENPGYKQFTKKIIVSLPGLNELFDDSHKLISPLENPPKDFTLVNSKLKNFSASISASADHLIDAAAITDVSEDALLYRNTDHTAPIAGPADLCGFKEAAGGDSSIAGLSMKTLCTQMVTKIKAYTNGISNFLNKITIEQAINVPDMSAPIKKVTALLPEDCNNIDASASDTSKRLALATKWLTFSHNIRLVGQLIQDTGALSSDSAKDFDTTTSALNTDIEGLTKCLSKRLQNEAKAHKYEAVDPQDILASGRGIDPLDAPLATLRTHLLGGAAINFSPIHRKHDTISDPYQTPIEVMMRKSLTAPAWGIGRSSDHKLNLAPEISAVLKKGPEATLVQNMRAIENAIAEYERIIAGNGILDERKRRELALLKKEYEKNYPKLKFMKEYADSYDKYKKMEEIRTAKTAKTFAEVEKLLNKKAKTAKELQDILKTRRDLLKELSATPKCEKTATAINNDRPKINEEEEIVSVPNVGNLVFGTSNKLKVKDLKRNLIEQCKAMDKEFKEAINLLIKKHNEQFAQASQGKGAIDEGTEIDAKKRKKIQEEYVISSAPELFAYKRIVGSSSDGSTVGETYKANVLAANMDSCTDISPGRISLISEYMADIIKELDEGNVKRKKMDEVAKVSCNMSPTAAPAVPSCANIDLKPGMVLGRNGGGQFQECLSGLYQRWATSGIAGDKEKAKRILYLSRKHCFIRTNAAGQLILQDISQNNRLMSVGPKDLPADKVNLTSIFKEGESYNQYIINAPNVGKAKYEFDLRFLPDLGLKCGVEPKIR